MKPFRVFKHVVDQQKIRDNVKVFMNRNCPSNDANEIFINPSFNCHATGWRTENSIIAINNGQVTITETQQPSRIFQYVELEDNTYFITVVIVSGSANVSVNDILLAENNGPGTHSYTLVNDTPGVYAIQFGTMAGVTTVFETCSLKQLNEVRTPVMVGYEQPYGEVIASNEFESC